MSLEHLTFFINIIIYKNIFVHSFNFFKKIVMQKKYFNSWRSAYSKYASPKEIKQFRGKFFCT